MAQEKEFKQEKTTKTGGKGKRFHKRNNREVKTDDVKCVVGGPGNDFSWWNKEPELLRDAANFKSNYIAGTSIAPGEISYIPAGVMTIYLESVYGANKSAVDPINVWARDLYLRMFQKYRGISSYSAADLGIALIAAAEVVKLIASYERIYGIINRYSKLNVNMPYAELESLGVPTASADALRGRLSDFRYDLNYLIKKAQRLCIPKDMSILADAISLFGYEYLDHNDPRAQIISFALNSYGVYDDTTVTAGGYIHFVAAPLFTDWFDLSADNMCKALEASLNALLGSDSIQRIFADLTVWFGEESMLTIQPMPEDYLVIPTYSESILHKVHNLECFSDVNARLASQINSSMTTADKTALETGDRYVYQFNDDIITVCNMVSSTGSYSYANINGFDTYLSTAAAPKTLPVHILDTYRVDMDPETVTEGVIFKAHWSALTAGNNYGNRLDTAVLYLCTKIYVTGMTTAGTVTGSAMVNVGTNNAGMQQAAGSFALFDWAPLTYFINTSNVVNSVYGDMDNLVPLHYVDVSRLQRAILLSAFHTEVRAKV